MWQIIKKTIILCVCLIGWFALSNCEKSIAAEGDHAAMDNQNLQSQIQTKDNNSKSEIPSFESLTNKIETIDSINDKQTTKIDIQESNLKGQERNLLLWGCIAFTLFIISILISVISFLKIKGLRRRLNSHREGIKKINEAINDITSQLTNLPRLKASSTPGDRDLKNLSNRIAKLESFLNQAGVSPTPIQSIKNANSPNTKENYGASQFPPKAFFGIPSRMSETSGYFKELFASPDNADARFSTTIRDNIAEFSPLDGTRYYNEFKSSDALKLSVDFIGSIPTEIRSMTIIKPGKAKYEGSIWVIVDKAKIKFE